MASTSVVFSFGNIKSNLPQFSEEGHNIHARAVQPTGYNFMRKGIPSNFFKKEGENPLT